MPKAVPIDSQALQEILDRYEKRLRAVLKDLPKGAQIDPRALREMLGYDRKAPTAPAKRVPKDAQIDSPALGEILAHYEKTLRTLEKEQSRLLAISLATAATAAAIAKKVRINHGSIGAEMSRLKGAFRVSQSIQIDAESLVRELMK
jgi:hypothetical protein